MFDMYTFGVQARLPQQTYCDISPLDNRFPSSPLSHQTSPSPSLGPRSSIMELTSQLDCQTLELECDDLYSSQFSLSTPSSDAELEIDQDMGRFENNNSHIVSVSQSVPQKDNSPPKTKNPTTCRRHQRQVNTQLLCTSSQQRKSIDDLVEEMVNRENQCTVLATSIVPEVVISQSSTIIQQTPYIPIDMADDEGFFDADEVNEGPEAAEILLRSLSRNAGPDGNGNYTLPLQHRRAGDWRSTSAIKCPARVRKRIGRRKSAGRERPVS